MPAREPSSVAILSARIQRAYPSLSAYSAASLATDLCAIERAQRRHAEAQCNGDYYRGPTSLSRLTADAAKAAEQRAGERILDMMEGWMTRVSELIGNDCSNWPYWETHGDPRGPVLLLRLPGETEASGV